MALCASQNASFRRGLSGAAVSNKSSYWAQHGIDVQQTKQPNQSLMFSPKTTIFEPLE
jgi:hypothetical protein